MSKIYQEPVESETLQVPSELSQKGEDKPKIDLLKYKGAHFRNHDGNKRDLLLAYAFKKIYRSDLMPPGIERESPNQGNVSLPQNS